MISVPSSKNISKKIPPNYSTWQTIELSYQCAKYAIDNNIEGVFVECGVASGNNLAAMAAAGREVVGFDSFKGIPWAGPNDEVQPGMRSKVAGTEGILESSGITVHPLEDVELNFAIWGLTNYRLINGWFQHTVMDFKEPIAVLRLDGDLYDSTMVCLENLYPLLSKGGILIMDDWNLLGCRRAFSDYFFYYPTEGGHQSENHPMRPELILDNGVTYWKK